MMKTIKKSELYNFTEKQKTAQHAVKKYKYTLYGGAMGGGKSYWLRWMLISLLLTWAKKGIENVEVGLFCEDYPTLKDRQISKIEKEFPKWMGTFHSDHKAHGKCFILEPEYGSGIIKLRNLDDPSKYQSAEFAAIAVDELTKNEFETFEDLRNRLRWTGIEDVKFLAGTNPGGIGHAWAKKYWMDKDFPPEETESNEFAYIQAKADDNPYLAESYLKQLDSLSPDKRKAFRDGDWDIFKGQYFSEFRREIHVVEPFTIPHDWRKFLMLDYGYTKPSAVYWGAVSPDDVLIIYRELYKTELGYSELVDEAVSMYPDSEEIKYWVADPSIWSKEPSNKGGMSGAEVMQNRYREIKGSGLNLVRGVNDRLNGWALLREYLKPYIREGELTAKLQIFSTCTNLIRTLPSLVYDTRRVEDLDTDGDDHAADAIRYGIMSRPKASMNPERVKDKQFDSVMRKKGLKRLKSGERGFTFIRK